MTSTTSNTIRRLIQAGNSAAVKLVRITALEEDNRYAANEIEFDTDGSTKLVPDKTLFVTNLAEPADTAGQVPADTDAVAIDVEAQWVIFVRQATAATFPAKVVASLGGAAYTIREQQITGAGTFIDKPDTANVTAHNLAELSLGPGAAVDDGAILFVATMLDNANPPTLRYVFDHPAYAKYLN